MTNVKDRSTSFYQYFHRELKAAEKSIRDWVLIRKNIS